MARGFGATLGTGATDNIQTTLSAQSTLRSYFIRYIKRSLGGSSIGNPICTVNTGAGQGRVSFQMGAVPPIMQFIRGFSTTNGVWEFTTTADSSTVWHTLLLVYDGSATANNPTVYVDGLLASINLNTAPVGTIDNTANTHIIGNRGTSLDRNWDGVLADFAVWDVILTQYESNALAEGYSPLLIRPASLVEHVPMLRNNVSARRAAPTITGTAVQPHPLVIMPRPVVLGKFSAVAAPTFKSAWASGANLPVLGTGNY